MLFARKSQTLPRPEEALPGRAERLFPLSGRHAVNGRSIFPPFPEGSRTIQLGMGCFWGAERLFWQQPGVWVTAVGYAGGYTPNPLYEEVCSGRTGHAEVVLVVYDPAVLGEESLLRLFFESHDPTQGMRQGNDIGTQYRSAVYWSEDVQRATAERLLDVYGPALARAGFGPITTEIRPAGPFWYAEEDHQQYLYKRPWGYCGLAGTGVRCPQPGGTAP
ncbi:MAG: peptide-methionine (S)-S-oxide reductase MsrA [Geminicoccaceae bacterium]|nr:peptide-methionine (S)-S-oxide reductase MsrA [Geminicoccaceae bacterium]MCX8099860.1 peptide-methionine (S)-S-oxide reductase MsrA [Geminicoccaceae bacterium]MDW8371476.1 peptide-methionine (S)-S-oxide reductase MsrA [Geminicoccaceae bacterium]